MTFGAASTADDVLAGLDLRGRRVLVTGASAGIGAELAGTLAAHGADVVGTARDVAARSREDCRVAEVVDDPASRVGVRSYALDAANAEALWTASEALVGERF